MKVFWKKCIIVTGIVLLFVIGIGVFINEKFENINYSLDEMNNNNRYPLDEYVYDYKMVSRGENNLSVTPISANIASYILTLKVKLKNETGHNLVIRDFARAEFGGYELPCSIESDNYNLDNNSEQDITVSFNVSSFRRINVIPTEIIVYLGTTENDNYYEYELTNFISWN